MARIRTIKPEIAADKKLASASRDARYTFILLITQSDDEGLIAAAPRQLLGALYPHDDAVSVRDLTGWITELVTIGLLAWRSTVDGSPVLQIVNWTKHQRVDNKSRSQLAATLAPLADSRGESPQVAEVRGLDLGPRTVGPRTEDHGSGTEDRAAAPPVDRSITLEPVAQLLTDYDFGQYAPLVEYVCRSSRLALASVSILRMHLTGESGYEPATAQEIGRACQAYAANGEPFIQALFGGYVSRAKKIATRAEGKRRHATEQQFISSEQHAREEADAEDAEGLAIVKAFAESHPERYRSIAMAENSAVPMSITFGRENIIHGRILAAIRREPPAAAKGAA